LVIINLFVKKKSNHTHQPQKAFLNFILLVDLWWYWVTSGM